jgi:hypothetical protein
MYADGPDIWPSAYATAVGASRHSCSVLSKMVYKSMLSSSLPKQSDAHYLYFSCQFKIRLLTFIQGITCTDICTEVRKDFYVPCQSSNLYCKKTCDHPFAFLYLPSFLHSGLQTIKSEKTCQNKHNIRVSHFSTHLSTHGCVTLLLAHCFPETSTH